MDPLGLFGGLFKFLFFNQFLSQRSFTILYLNICYVNVVAPCVCFRHTTVVQDIPVQVAVHLYNLLKTNKINVRLVSIKYIYLKVQNT